MTAHGVRYVCDVCQCVHYNATAAAGCHGGRFAAVDTDTVPGFWQRYYNGHTSQDAWHAAMHAAMPAYLAARREGMARNPDGWRHADCDHAYGICSG